MKPNLSAALNVYLANIGVEYVKLHHLHWNVVGSQFKAVHEYLETLYDGLANVLDATAEVLKINGQAPLSSMKGFLAVATIQELEGGEVEVPEALRTVLSDLELLKAQAEAIRAVAVQEDQYDVVALMEGDLAQYSKTLWFLRATLR